MERSTVNQHWKMTLMTLNKTRADIVCIDRNGDRGLILDPTRWEFNNEHQDNEINEEKDSYSHYSLLPEKIQCLQWGSSWTMVWCTLHRTLSYLTFSKYCKTEN